MAFPSSETMGYCRTDADSVASTTLIVDAIAHTLPLAKDDTPPLNEEWKLTGTDLATISLASHIIKRRPAVRRRFNQLVAEWNAQRNRLSSFPEEWSMCMAYQKIIGMGLEAVPLILEQLKRSSAHWFWALNAITDHNPVKAENEGNLAGMTSDWLAWGVENGYVSR